MKVARLLLVNLEKSRGTWKTRFVDPILQLRGFDKTEMSGKMVRNFMGPGLQLFSVSPNSQIFNFQDLRSIEISMY